MGHWKSKNRDFKSYVNAGFRHGCCCLSASLRAKTLREIKGNMAQCKSEDWDFKENMGQSESKERDFKE
jgi:hypothetical protein